MKNNDWFLFVKNKTKKIYILNLVDIAYVFCKTHINGFWKKMSECFKNVYCPCTLSKTLTGYKRPVAFMKIINIQIQSIKLIMKMYTTLIIYKCVKMFNYNLKYNGSYFNRRS